MAEPQPIRVPLVNANEPEASLAALDVREGQRVRRGERLAVLETTKATSELHAERDGYVIGVSWNVGDTLRAGEVLAYLAEQPDQAAPVPNAAAGQEKSAAESDLPEGLRITQPALALARQLGLDLAALPHGPLLTETQVRALSSQKEKQAAPAVQAAFDASAILVYGGGGHGKSVIDLLRALGGFQVVGVIDDGLPVGAQVLGVPVLGSAERLAGMAESGVRLAVNAVGGISSIASRALVFDRLAQAGLACPAIVHPSATVEPSARLSAGVQVFPHAYVGSAAQVGFGAIVNTGAIVSHDCILGEISNISPGAMLAGGVQVGERVLIGMGATINLEVKIGAGARVGNSATVKADVPPGGVVRAGAVWPG